MDYIFDDHVRAMPNIGSFQSRYQPQRHSGGFRTTGYGSFIFPLQPHINALDTSCLHELRTAALSDEASTCSSETVSDHEATPVVSSPKAPLPPRIYKPCFVCGDRSSGYHYGISSCEGCKGFFRRSIKMKMQYSCRHERKCVINKQTRSRCQFCRLQKCLDVGMLKESVRNDRTNRRGKEKKTLSPTSTIAQPIYIPPFFEELINIVSNAHSRTSPRLQTVKKHRFEHFPTTKKEDSLNMKLWTLFSERSAMCIEKIVDFAKCIPGFSECSATDQITMIKSASMDVLVLQLCSRFQPDEDTVTFSDGLTLDRSELRSCGLGPITDAVYSFAEKIHSLQLDETEISLLCAICLVCSDRPDLEVPDKVEKLQEPLLEALRLYSRKRRPSNPLIFPKLLMKISDLRSISLRGTDTVESISNEIETGNMSPLISEMLRRGCY